jgi:tetratricopeptide (TPR) repeat protein
MFKVPKDVAEKWYNKAAEYGSPEAWMKMGEIKELQGHFPEAISCYEKAMEFGHAEALSAIERCKQVEQRNPSSQQNKFIKDIQTVVQNFERQVKSGRTGKHGRVVDFAYIVANLKKLELLFASEDNKKLVNYFESDSIQPKYSNRFYGLLGYLAQRDVFDNLSHKDILDICADETGENKSDVSDFIRRMGGKANLNPANIAKMSDRIITGGIKKMLDKAVIGKL